MTTDKQTFHVVRHSHNDVFRTYSIYANNRPFLTPTRGRVLGRREAYAIARLLNQGPWVVSHSFLGEPFERENPAPRYGPDPLTPEYLAEIKAYLADCGPNDRNDPEAYVVLNYIEDLIAGLEDALWVIYHMPHDDIRPADLREWQDRRAKLLTLVP